MRVRCGGGEIRKHVWRRIDEMYMRALLTKG